MNRVATLATAEKEKAIGEHTSIVQMPPERNEPSCLGGGVHTPFHLATKFLISRCSLMVMIMTS